MDQDGLDWVFGIFLRNEILQSKPVRTIASSRVSCFLLQLRLVKLHPGEVFNDSLDVVEELVNGVSDHEQSLHVKRSLTSCFFYLQKLRLLDRL